MCLNKVDSFDGIAVVVIDDVDAVECKKCGHRSLLIDMMYS